MKIAQALMAIALVSTTATSAFAGDFCGVRKKSIPVLGKVEYNYTHKNDIIHLDIVALSGVAAQTMINQGLHDAVSESGVQDADQVDAFLDSVNFTVGTKAILELKGGKTVVEVGAKRGEFNAGLLNGLAKVIESKIASGDGGSAKVSCK